MRINNNISALNAWRGLTNTDNSLSKSLEKLSSGLRINRAGDDAAGLAISEKMRGQIRGLNMAVKNAQDGISLIQSAEGALTETHSILQRMRELAVQSANDTNTDEDRIALDQEVQDLKTELNRIANNTEFNTKRLLDGTFGAFVDRDSTASTIFDVAGIASVSTTGGLNAGKYKISKVDADGTKKGLLAKNHLSFAIDTNKGITAKAADADGAGTITFTKWETIVTGKDTDGNNIEEEVDTGIVVLTIKTNSGYTAGTAVGDVAIKGDQSNFQIGANKDQIMGLSINDMTADGLEIAELAIGDYDSAQSAIQLLDQATAKVSIERAKLGAAQNRLEHTIKNLGVSAENLAAAESRIRDVDMAAEMMNFTKQNILMQAGTAMLAQANARPQSVLQLLG